MKSKYVKIKSGLYNSVKSAPFDKANLIFCCTGSRENYFGSVCRSANNNNSKFQDHEFVDSGF